MIIFAAFPVFCNATRALLMNAVSLEGENSASIMQMKAILDEIHDDSHLWSTITTKVAYVRESCYKHMPQEIRDHIEKELGVVVKYYSVKPLPDAGIARKEKQIEQVTAILEALSGTMSSKDESLISLTFSKSSRPMPTANFNKLFDLIGPQTEKHQVLLLEKNIRITSQSDWHDLQVLAIAPSNAGVAKWLHTLNETYMHHADRVAHTLLEPRPAILEANLVHGNSIKIGFLGTDKVCALSWKNGEHAQVLSPSLILSFLQRCTHLSLHLVRAAA